MARGHVHIKQQRGLRVSEVAGLGRMPNPKRQTEQFLNQTERGRKRGRGERVGERGKAGREGAEESGSHIGDLYSLPHLRAESLTCCLSISAAHRRSIAQHAIGST